MKYYAVSDVHGFYGELERTLREKGFFSDTEPHLLVLCGDALDRGKEATATVSLLETLRARGELVFVLGNHEDLFVDCLEEISHGGVYDIASGLSHHYRNGTWETLLRLAAMNANDAVRYPGELVRRVMRSPFYRELLSVGVDYFETAHYVFCHGYIPTHAFGYRPSVRYRYDPDWRAASVEDWRRARWLNGMELACRHHIREEGKTVVCGHFHTSYGHATVDHRGSEWGENAVFTPFTADGLIALDGCTAYSGVVNCVVLEDEPLS